MIRKALPQFILFITLIALTGFSQAQTRRKVTLQASVPFEFIVGNRTFPAGTYVFEMATGTPQRTDHTGVLIVRNQERRLFAAVVTDVAADEFAHDTPNLMFQRTGDRVYLSKVWRQGDGAALSVHRTPIASEENWQESEVLMLNATPPSGLM